MRDAVIVSALRTPVGKMRQSLARETAQNLSATIMQATLAKMGIDPKEVDEVIWGNLYNYDIGNMGRVSWLQAGLPQTVPSTSIERRCASSLNAVAIAAVLVQTGNADIIMAGGVDSYSKQPFLVARPEEGYPSQLKFIDVKRAPENIGDPALLMTAENVAEQYNISRGECDEFAQRSHYLAGNAWRQGKFDEQVVPYMVKSKSGDVLIDRDDCVRPDCKIEDLAKLKPAIKKDGVVTAGNSSPMNDGASAILIMEKNKALDMGLEPLAYIKGFASSGCDPHYMGIGPVSATQKLLKREGLKIEDFDLIELNEAFASQSVACARELNISLDKLNVNGGAIAIGHPNAASGGILTARMVYEMRDRDAKRGLISFCVGGGQGFSLILERM